MRKLTGFWRAILCGLLCAFASLTARAERIYYDVVLEEVLDSGDDVHFCVGIEDGRIEQRWAGRQSAEVGYTARANCAERRIVSGGKTRQKIKSGNCSAAPRPHATSLGDRRASK
jgi:hypothetical protein